MCVHDEKYGCQTVFQLFAFSFLPAWIAWGCIPKHCCHMTQTSYHENWTSRIFANDFPTTELKGKAYKDLLIKGCTCKQKEKWSVVTSHRWGCTFALTVLQGLSFGWGVGNEWGVTFGGRKHQIDKRRSLKRAKGGAQTGLADVFCLQLWDNRGQGITAGCKDDFQQHQLFLFSLAVFYFV